MFDGYSIASGSVDITPRTPIPLAGYAALRKATFDRVADPLEANVVVLRGGDATLVFVAFDLMYVGAYLGDELVNILAGHVPGDAIFATAAHTHSAPPTEDSLPILGTVTPSYREFVAQRTSDLVLRLLSGPFIPVSLEYLEGGASHSVNRRKRVVGIGRDFPYLGTHIKIEPNLSGPRDDMIRMIRIRDNDGKDIAACWSYGCHPVGFPLINDLSAEYPGVVRNMIRGSFGNIAVVFWQGFSGNIGPLVVRTPSTPSLPTTYGFTAPTLKDWRDWASSLGQRAVHIAGGQGSLIGGPISSTVRALPRSELGLSSEKQLRLHEIRLGQDLVMCGLSAEVAVEYVQ